MSEQPAPRSARLPREQRRQQLLDTALQVFVAEGYHAASMDAIASAAGVTKPVLYQHFASKRDLYLALLESSLDDLLTTARAELSGTTDNKQRVSAMAQAYFTFICSPTGAYRLVFESDLANDPDVRARVDAADLALAHEAARVISTDTGLSEEQALLIASGMQGMVEVAARRWLRSEHVDSVHVDSEHAGVPGDREKHRIDQQQAIDLLVGLAWRGIRGFPATHPPR